MRNELLSAALAYLERGWSIIPISTDDKRPARRWKTYQSKPPTTSTLQAWFGNGSMFGIGVIFGDVSRGLASRDFDGMTGYERWAHDFPELAGSLPTVETRRGRHVYFRAAPDRITALRTRLGKADSRGAIPFADGELRCGCGCYSVLPPSRHPSGVTYRWIVPLPAGELPVIDPLTAGFVPSCGVETESAERTETTEIAETTERTERTEESGRNKTSVCVLKETNPQEWPVDVHQAIQQTLPKGPGQRHRAVFAFARALKGIPFLCDADALTLEPYLRQWHHLALPTISTQPFEESLIDFLRAWPRVKFPAGAEPMRAVLARAAAAEPPIAAKQFEQPQLWLLVSLCRELQAAVGDAPFFLASRTAANLLEVPPTQAWRWLFLLEQKGVLHVTERGSRATNRATRYRYQGGA